MLRKSTVFLEREQNVTNSLNFNGKRRVFPYLFANMVYCLKQHNWATIRAAFFCVEKKEAQNQIIIKMRRQNENDCWLGESRR